MERSGDETGVREERLERRSSALPTPAVLLVNTRSRLGQTQFRTALRLLEAHGLALAASRPLTDPPRVGVLVRSAVEQGAKLVVVGGGDGTLGAAADVLAHTETALGVLPLGTGNDFARSLGIPLELEPACRALAHGRVSRVDVGLVSGHVFLNAASIGVSATIARRLDPRLKRRLGTLAYAATALRHAFALRPFRAWLQLDERRLELEALEVVVGNGRFHGGGRLVSPEATLHDHQLDVYAILSRERGIWDDLRTLAPVGRLLKGGTHVQDEHVLHFRTRSLALSSRPRKTIDVDGELRGRTPAQFECLSDRLRVVVPGSSTP